MPNSIRIDEGLISYLEDLSYLTLTAEEKDRLMGDLEEILGGMARLSEFDAENVPECSHPFDNTNAFREDVPQASLDRELILKNAPDRGEDMFIVPKTVTPHG